MNKVLSVVKALAVNDVVVRAVKTAVQTFASVVALGVAGVVDVASVQALVLAAGSAAVSAAWNSAKSRK